MLYHFGDFELDEGGRELRLAGREVVLQPRVFDLLVYLVRHRDRVITKDELLETLWPDVIVADGALQRAVSLARSALRSGGAVDAIRTYARHGYRFCAEVTGERPEEASPEHAQPDDRLANARRAFEAAAWAEAAGRYEEVDASEQLGGADLERWAQALHFSGRPQPALGPLERAVAAHLAAGDRRGAARAAVLIVFLQFENLELAVAKGWSRRAASLLEELPESREHGLLAYHRSRFGLAGGDLDEALRRAGEARDIGRRLDDSDVLALGLTAMGLAQLAAGNVQAGVALHDEAAATVLAGGVSPLHGGLVYCGVIFGCRNLQDWERAAQWSDQFTRWCTDNGVSEVHGTCRLHRGEVLAVRGELEEAEREISDACRELAVIAPWVEGDGHRVLGEICMARGDLEGAEKAFHRARELGWDPHPSYALFQLAQEKRTAALRGLERALADPGWANRQRRGLLLAHLALVAVACGDLQRARRALDELDAAPELWATLAMTAQVQRARAELELAEGRTAPAIALMRQAMRRWQQVGSSWQVAGLRLRLAELLAADGDPETAGVECAAARTTFEAIGADALVQRCDELGDTWSGGGSKARDAAVRPDRR